MLQVNFSLVDELTMASDPLFYLLRIVQVDKLCLLQSERLVGVHKVMFHFNEKLSADDESSKYS